MKNFSLQIALIFLGAMAPHVLMAAQFNLIIPNEKFGKGDVVDVAATLDTKGESINAVEGTLVAPPYTSIVRIHQGNSIVALWLERPTSKGQQVSFSGIIPNGFSAVSGNLITVTLKSEKQGNDKITLSGNAYRNDGSGSRVDTKAASVPFVVGKESTNRTFALDYATDQERPEAFIPVIATDPNLFDGAPFLTFETQDKLSGIKGFMVAEAPAKFMLFTPKTPTSGWKTVESPLQLTEEMRSKFIFIKAIDNNNNERIAFVAPSSGLYQYKMTMLWVILVLLALVAFTRIMRRKRA